MSVLRFTLPAAAAVLLLFSGLAHAASADELYTAGAKKYYDGNYDHAEAYFKKAIQANPGHASTMFMLGETISQDVRRLSEAEGWYKKALGRSGGDSSIIPRTLVSLGRLYILLGQHEDALSHFNRLLNEYPDYYDLPGVYNQMGIAYYRLDRYDEALANFKAALRLNPGLMEAVFNMKTVQNQLSILNTARYHQRMGNNKAAIENYKSAIERYPNYVAAWYHLGLVYLDEGSYDLAVKQLVRARALNTGYLGDEEIPYRLAGAYAGRGGPGDVQSAIDIYLGLGGYKDSVLQAGMLYLKTGSLEQAEDLLLGVTKQVADKPAMAEANYQLGLLDLKRGNRDSAMEHFVKALSAAPDVDRYRNPPVGDGVTIEPVEQEEVDEDEDYEPGMDEYY